MRAGTLFKSIIPNMFLLGKWAVYADADEFLFLPPGFQCLQDLIEVIERDGSVAVAASLVDFFPQCFDLHVGAIPVSLPELLLQSPYFDAEPLIKVNPNNGYIETKYYGASSRIVMCSINKKDLIFNNILPSVIKRYIFLGQFSVPNYATFKTPLVKWERGIRYTGSHRVNAPVSTECILTEAHFKYTPDLIRRTRMALEAQSYARKSIKYQHMSLVIECQKDYNSLLGPTSKRFYNVDDFIDAGLMRVPKNVI